ncbi:MAG: 16S rRNA (guanine(527)-N(7))-methyltransferase RsmG [Jiangellaceae bacterium]|nr:16S rRNA (guanine(527)-N(7))-methyltransferase RsmG [Jiangellaceae bacterium]
MGDAEQRPAQPPAQASDVFAARLPLAVEYAAMLAGPGTQRGLLGPREAPQLWQRHILNCAVIHPALPERCRVVDIGSGAGLPGVVLAIVRPDLQVILVEPMQRRAGFLTEVVAELGLANATVRRARAEELAGELRVPAVTARAVAPLDRLATWALPLLATGGRLLALKGQRAVDELRRTEAQVRTMGAVSCSVEEFGHGIVDPPTRVAVIEVGASVSEAVSGRRTKGSRWRRSP